MSNKDICDEYGKVVYKHKDSKWFKCSKTCGTKWRYLTPKKKNKNENTTTTNPNLIPKLL